MYIYIYHHYNTHSNKIKQKWRKIGTFLRFKGCYDQLKKVFSTYYPTLGITFPDEFIDYVKEYGAISFYGTEWMGLNVDGYINVVDATKQERDINDDFPSDCFFWRDGDKHRVKS